jgi:hypothetical protein
VRLQLVEVPAPKAIRLIADGFHLCGM